MCSPDGKERISRPCHLHELFVTSGGYVYPCCLTWNRPDLKIGHLGDEGLMEKIGAFNGTCSCGTFVLRGGDLSEAKDYKLNMEFSLDCNGRCAMCCVDAPSGGGEYRYYKELSLLAGSLPSIGHVVVQGGEVLIQKKSMRWIADFRNERPSIPVAIITNGNVPVSIIPEVESLFCNVLVSMYGFQDETYRRITGMDLERTVEFASELVRRKKTTVHLKYLVTPLNLHEVNLFFSWAAELGPETISIVDSWSEQYIRRDTRDGYWNTIIDRTADALKREIASHSDVLKTNGTVVLLDALCRSLFGIDGVFVASSGLDKIIKKNPLVG
jgi:pyruvate-formate lyase-activating enzyme